MRLLLGLSGWTANDWTGGRGARPARAAGRAERRPARRHRRGLPRRPGADLRADPRSGPGAAPAFVAAGLNRLALLGQVIHDLHAGPLSLAAGHAGGPLARADRPGEPRDRGRRRAGRARHGARSTATRRRPDGLRILEGESGGRAVSLLLDADGRMLRGRCTCSHHFTGGLRKGPCRHLQALRLGRVRHTTRATDPGLVVSRRFSIDEARHGLVPTHRPMVDGPRLEPDAAAIRLAVAGAGSPRTAADPYFSRARPSSSIKKAKALGLDAGAFLPITREEIKQAAKGQNLFANPWFGRRDLIPPADDPRTKLIDRAMVTQGLLTPEELAEIHRVGDEMERVRPSLEGDRASGRAGGRGGRRRPTARPAPGSRPEEGRGRRAEASAGPRPSPTAGPPTSSSSAAASPAGWATARATSTRLAAAGLPVLSTPAELAAGPRPERSRGCAGWPFTPRPPRGPTTSSSRSRRRAAARGPCSAPASHAGHGPALDLRADRREAAGRAARTRLHRRAEHPHQRRGRTPAGRSW